MNVDLFRDWGVADIQRAKALLARVDPAQRHMAMATTIAALSTEESVLAARRIRAASISTGETAAIGVAINITFNALSVDPSNAVEALAELLAASPMGRFLREFIEQDHPTDGAAVVDRILLDQLVKVVATVFKTANDPGR